MKSVPVGMEKVNEQSALPTHIVTIDCATITEPSPLYAVVHAEMADMRAFVSKANGNKGDMLEVVRRSFRLLGVDPGIGEIEFMCGACRIELIVRCRDSRAALGEKGSTMKQATSIIEEAIGVSSLAVFAERC